MCPDDGEKVEKESGKEKADIPHGLGSYMANQPSTTVISAIREAAPHLWHQTSPGTYTPSLKVLQGTELWSQTGLARAIAQPLAGSVSITSSLRMGKVTILHLIRPSWEFNEVMHLGLKQGQHITGSQQLLIPPLPTTSHPMSGKYYLRDTAKCIRDMCVKPALRYAFSPVTLANMVTLCDRGGIGWNIQ